MAYSVQRIPDAKTIWLFRDRLAQAGQAGIREYAALARVHGLTPAQMALACCYSRWFMGSTIVGATTLDQPKESINAAEIVLSDEVVKQIDEIHGRITNSGAVRPTCPWRGRHGRPRVQSVHAVPQYSQPLTLQPC